MGQSFAKLFSLLLGKKEIHIVMVGLDAAGKTTILYKLKLGKIVTTTPTIGCNFETLEYKNINFVVSDIGAYNLYKLQDLMHNYLYKAQGLIFVVDSTDHERMGDARDELHNLMLKQDRLKDGALIVFANKQDLPGAMNAAEISDKLGLHSLGLQHLHIQSTSATSGEGLYEGLDWLFNNIANKDIGANTHIIEIRRGALSNFLSNNFTKISYILINTNIPGDFLGFVAISDSTHTVPVVVPWETDALESRHEICFKGPVSNTILNQKPLPKFS